MTTGKVDLQQYASLCQIVLLDHLGLILFRSNYGQRGDHPKMKGSNYLLAVLCRYSVRLKTSDILILFDLKLFV